jgi:hypothetical protein
MATDVIRYWRDLHRWVNQKVYEAMVAELPIGSLVTYEHGEHVITVEVIEHARGIDSVKVRGRSGKEYWLDLSRLSEKVE